MALILMVLGFVWWWPVGLIILAFLIARGRFSCWHRPMYAGNGPMNDGRWNDNMDRWEGRTARMQEKIDRVRARMDRFRTRGAGGNWWGTPPSSGNRAFDDYRTETLQRLEEEQREFKEFLERLRFAKDRAEFDQFMNERRDRPAPDRGQQPQPQA